MSAKKKSIATTKRKSAAIIGAGIGGLSAALALSRRGWRVALFEQAPAIEPIGAGIQLSPNATHILTSLGLGPDLRARGHLPAAVELRDGLTGRDLARVALGPSAEALYGAPFVQMRRADLVALLLEAVEAAGVAVHLGQRAQGDPDGTLRLDGHSAAEPYDLIIAANGLRSATREALFPRKLRYSGMVAYRAAVKTPAPSGNTVNWIAPRAHVVAYPMDAGETCNLVAITTAKTPPGDGWTHDASPTDLTHAFANFAPEVRALLTKAETPRAWGLFEVDPLPQWHKGRLALLGDAAHGMLPFLAQGAGMAIEDAAALAEALGADATTEAALTTYQTTRIARVAQVAAATRRSGAIYHKQGPMRLARNLVMRSGVINMQTRLDWLYGYRVTSGAG